MNTDQLIAILSDDLAPVRRGMVARWLSAALTAGLALAVLALLFWLHPRHDLAAAVTSGPFWMKFVYTAVLMLIGLVVLERQARAGADSQKAILALGVPVVALIVLAAVELSAPNADSAALVMGHSWTACPVRIVELGLPFLAVLLLALRQLAPTRLTLAGAAAGLVAGAGAATIYGFHCNEVGAPFLLIWYTLGIAIVAGFGAFLGRWALRW